MKQEIFPYIKRILQGANVSWKPLGEVCLIANNKRKPIRADNRISGKIPYYGANNIQDYVEGYTHNGEYILIAEDGSKSLENYSIQYVNGKFWANNHIHIVSGKEYLNNRFLFHWLSQYNFKPFLNGGDRAKLTTVNLKKLQIPLPPLSVQQEIVRILDKFTQLEAELEAELDCRKQQYEYYRDMLLTYDENQVEWKTLGEVAKKISSGGTPKTSISEYYNGDIPWLRTQEVGYGEIWDTSVKITDEAVKNSSAKWIPENCVIVAMYGATVGRVGINKIPLTTNQACANIEVNENIANYKYVYYCLLNQYEYIKSLGVGSQTNINAQIVKNIQIPIPPIEEQERIAGILDKFDTLVNSTSEGLPREIELRRKQYEYYREKLLSFPTE